MKRCDKNTRRLSMAILERASKPASVDSIVAKLRRQYGYCVLDCDVFRLLNRMAKHGFVEKSMTPIFINGVYIGKDCCFSV